MGTNGVDEMEETDDPRIFTFDGEPVDLEELLDENREGLDEEEVAAIRAMQPGDSITFGGGAAAEFVVACRARWTPVDAECPACFGHLDVSFEEPQRQFRTTRRYKAAGLERDDVLYGVCAACDLLVVDVELMVASDEADRADVLEAIAGAQRARAIFDEGRGDSFAAMTELARAFHGLRSSQAPGIAPWDPVALLEWVQQGQGNHHAQHCAHFVLSVWNAGDTEEVLGPFNAMRALAGWDRAHRAAFVEWARAPWWP